MSQLALLLCLVVQACLLLTRLDLLPIWGDEHFTLGAASGSAMRSLRVIAGEKNNPPLHTLLVHFWLMIPWPVSKIAAARGLSVLFALASTVVMDRLWLKTLSPRARLWFLILWTLSPCLLLYSRIARPYSLEVLVFLVALRAAVGLLREPDALPRALVFGVGVTALLYVHYLPGLALLFSVLLILSWGALRQRRLAALAPATGVILLVVALYAPWLPQLGVAIERMAFAPPAAPAVGGWIPESIRPVYLLFSFSLGETPPLWVWMAAAPVITGIAYLAWRGASPRPEWLALVMLVAAAGYAAAGRWVSFGFTPGRLLFLLPFFLVLAALGAQRSPRVGALVCAAMLCLSAGSIASYFAKANFLNKGYLLPYDEIARVIRAGSPAARVVLVADSCNTDPAPLFDLVAEQVKWIVVTRESTLDSLRNQVDATGAGIVWCFRNTHDTSPGGVNRLLEEELAQGRPVRRRLFVPYSWLDHLFMKVLGWREQPTHFVQLLEIRRVESGPRPTGDEARLTRLRSLDLQVVGH